MCGIAGIVSRQNKIESARLVRMIDAIKHRGPDGAGWWLSARKNVGLAHRRLAIIDLSDCGKQPMHFADERFTITFNGEIYNYLELRRELETKGCCFQSTSDTEVLLALYAEQKEKCLDALDGMFAFAIWDEHEQTLFCARDRFGEKPFYFTLHDNTLFFASEMKALWAAGVPRVVSNPMLYNYLTDGRMFNSHDLAETFYENIYKLKAAHYFFVSPENLRVEPKCYWKIDAQTIDRDITDERAADEFRRLFDESVARRLRSDVAVGSSLSGGLDSSLIVCTIDCLNAGKQQRQTTFSARFPGFAKDEGEFMQAVIEQTNVEPHFVYPNENGLIENLDLLFHHQEEPFGSASIYAQFCVMQAARENDVTVLLDGQAADELLAGYHPYFVDYLSELKTRDKKSWRRERRLHANQFGAIGSGKFDFKKAAARFLPETLKTRVKKLRRDFAPESNGFVDPAFEREYKNTNFGFFEPPASLNEALRRSAFGGALEELLRYADRNSMAHSREVRLPFTSHKLAEFLFGLPPDFKIRNATTKYIMRQAFRDRLPAKIVNRTDKIGYEPPQKTWLENPRLIERIEDAATRLASENVLDKNALDFVRSREANRSIFASYNWKILMAANLTKNESSIAV